MQVPPDEELLEEIKQSPLLILLIALLRHMGSEPLSIMVQNFVSVVSEQLKLPELLHVVMPPMQKGMSF